MISNKVLLYIVGAIVLIMVAVMFTRLFVSAVVLMVFGAILYGLYRAYKAVSPQFKAGYNKGKNTWKK